jgi:hypothetical protein
MTKDEALEALSKLDINDQESHGKIYNKYFKTKLDQRYFEMFSSPSRRSMELIEAIIDDTQITLDLRDTDEYVF